MGMTMQGEKFSFLANANPAFVEELFQKYQAASP